MIQRMKKKKNIIDELSLNMLSVNDKDDSYSESKLIEDIKGVPDINMQGRDGNTLLILSACYNLIDVSKYLIDKGADVNKKSYDGFTALHCAVIHNNYDIAELLISSGANINALDGYGNNPIMRANHITTDMIKLLLSHGADPTIPNNYDINALQVFEAYPHIIELMKEYTKE